MRLNSLVTLTLWLLSSSTSAPLLAQTYMGADDPKTAAIVYGQGVRETDWQSAEQERAGFHLPPGFEIQLFASEPEIAKPLNMAWDHHGRLWVSSTVEYPYPAEEGAQPRDTIKILEDTNGDGRADRVTTFADQLNIPMGLLPVADGVVCFSIPNLWHLRDTDADDRADERIQLLGPFDTSRDTHGMINALRRGTDGWIYACHGFNNQSQVAAADGSTIHLISGNTFRFKPDGSRVEQYTHGQVNPFGMTQDEYGNWYTADCHSKPLTALLQGACYPSFGRPHDGLGFAPSMMEHFHGSTAISGLVYYRAEHFPIAYRRLFYSGNVMTSRINCNQLLWQGATAIAKELPDFLTSDDPWFRPVDIQMGPDGALYVADFYNKIIGHYEVPLTHPGRDRTSGRIWRITYTGSLEHEPPKALQVAAEEWMDRSNTVADLNPVRRRAIIENWIASSEPLEDLLSQGLTQQASAEARLACLEALGRRGELSESQVIALVESLSESDPSIHTRWLSSQVLQLAHDWPNDWRSRLLPIARRGCDSWESDPHLAKAALEFLGLSGEAPDVERLLQILDALDGRDPALTQVTRIAIRNLVQDSDNLRFAVLRLVGSRDAGSPKALPRKFLEVLPGVGTRDAAWTLLRHLEKKQPDSNPLADSGFAMLFRQLPASNREIEEILQFIDAFFPDDMSSRVNRFAELCEAYFAQHGKLGMPLTEYAERVLSRELLPQARRRVADHQFHIWLDEFGNPWLNQPRNLTSGESLEMISSHPAGERFTATLSSDVFECPKEVTFWLAGHNGPPAETDLRENFVRLVDALTGRQLAIAYPPRNDVAAKIVWDTSPWMNNAVRVEVVDGCRKNAYAWLAVGGFSVDKLNPQSAVLPMELLSRLLQAGCVDVEFAELQGLLDSMPENSNLRARLIAAWAQGLSQLVAKKLIDSAIGLHRPELVSTTLLFGGPRQEELFRLAKELSATATLKDQSQLSAALMTTAAGCQLVWELLQSGNLSSRCLSDTNPDSLPNSLDHAVQRSLRAAIEQARQGKPPLDVQSIVAGLDMSRADIHLGQQLFVQHCANCHQLQGIGKLVGPQLDGAVVRGLDRLAEDVLDSNRNVDAAFRQSTLLLENDSIVTGLAQDLPGGDILLTLQDGKQTNIAAQQIVERKQLDVSLMPGNFRELLDDSQLASLLAYLSSIAAQPR